MSEKPNLYQQPIEGTPIIDLDSNPRADKVATQVVNMLNEISFIEGTEIKQKNTRTQKDLDILKEKVKQIFRESGNASFENAHHLIRVLVKNQFTSAITEECFLDLVSWARDCSINPELLQETSLRVGIGGSTDAEPNFRLPAYLLPALEIQKQIKELGFEHTPKIELFFAPHAAIRLNKMPKKHVKKNKKRNKKLLLGFAQEFYPDANIVISEDQKEQSVIAKATIAYLCDLLRSQDDCEKIVKDLEVRGENRGGKRGKKNALEYAALHAYIFFQENLNGIPRLEKDMSIDKSKAVISIGGKPERIFNEFRRIVSERASLEGLIEFCEERNLVKELTALSTYIIQGQEEHKLSYSIRFIGSVGEHPVYYNGPDEVIANKETRETLSKNPHSLAERYLKKDPRHKDIHALINAIGADNLIDFFNNHIK